MISEQTALEAIQRLETAFNIHQRRGDELARIWMEEFKNVSEEQFQKAIAWWIRHEDKFPTVHQVHRAISEVGGPGIGKKTEYYEWINPEDMSKRPVLYWYIWDERVYSCILEKGIGDSAEPPKEFTNHLGLQAVREDIWKKEREKEIEKIIEKKRRKISEEEKRKQLEKMKQRIIKQVEILEKGG